MNQIRNMDYVIHYCHSLSCLIELIRGFLILGNNIVIVDTLSDLLLSLVEGHYCTEERCTAFEVRSAWKTEILPL